MTDVNFKRLKRLVPLIGVLLFAAALAACSSTISCMRMTGTGIHTACYGFFDELDDKRLITLDLGDVASRVSIDGQLGVYVTVGAVDVTYQNDEGNPITSQVSPKKPLLIEKSMRIVLGDQVQITVEARGGVASGVRFSAEFTG